MCGRFTLTSTPEALAERFEISLPASLRPRFNIAPSQEAWAIRQNSDAVRDVALLRWGLVPSWAADPSLASRQINARVETAAERPAYRSAWKARRCVIPADGFYEWENLGGGRQPHWIGLEAGIPFAMAGLWESWQAETGPALETFTLLTTTASNRISAIHGRMPVILAAETVAAWIDPMITPEPIIEEALAHPPDFASHPVATRVNDVRHDDAECAVPAAPMPRQESLF